MIGCARRSGKYICCDQFFAEKPEEEKLVLSAFLEILKQYDTIISFNGIGFDVPYLKAKCDAFDLPEDFKDYSYLDIFKSVSEIKFLLKLPNYKQKTIEGFLGIAREDEQTGGELINVYRDYVKHPEEEKSRLLVKPAETNREQQKRLSAPSHITNPGQTAVAPAKIRQGACSSKQSGN